MKKQLIWVLGIVAIIGLIYYFFFRSVPVADAPLETTEETPAREEVAPEEPAPVTPPVVEEVRGPESVIGTSLENRDITAYHFGDGAEEILFIGGIHGAYEWNTILVAYELIDHLSKNPALVPEGHTVTVIPALNPDGLFKVTEKEGRFTARDIPSNIADTVPGRFNARGVDLNRNFDCEWQKEGMWQTTKVSGGTAPFSEPESQAIRAYVEDHDIKAAIVWYSAAGGVFASSCNNGVSPETQALTDLFAQASGYRAYKEFDFYEITGDMVNWFAKEDIPAISVLLTTHTDMEWNKNRAGAEAVLKAFEN